MKRNRKIGISLIILVITIIVIIILAGAVMLSLANNNPISQASKATYLSDVRNFQTELGLYETNQFADKLGAYDLTKLQADETSVTYDGIVDTSKTMNDLIPTLGKAIKYSGQFIVVDGELVFQGSDTKKQDWSREAEIEVLIVGEPKVTIIPPSETVVASGTDIIYTVKFSSNSSLTSIDLAGKVEVLDNSGVALPIQPVVTIGTVSGTSSDAIRQVDITIKTDSLLTGGYKLKIKSGSVTNLNNISNTQDIISLIGFDIDSTPPENPTMSTNVAAWTNENVSVTITYSEDSIVKEYSFDSVTWNTYTESVVVTANNTTVYSRGKDASGNESGVATLTVTNIDKTLPTVTASNGGVTSSSVTVTAVASDTGDSGLNTSSYQYSKDNGVTWTTAASATNYTFTGLSTGTYQCKVKVVDNALNEKISTAVAISTTAIGTITLSANVAAWTNGNVTVTITYPAAVVTKQYSLDGANWLMYTSPVVVSTNNTTVYAKGADAGENQTSQSTLTVANIDKVAPTVTFVTNGENNVEVASTQINMIDAGGSGLNASTLQYKWDTQNVTTPSSGWAAFTNGNTLTKTDVVGTYYLWIKGNDNVGNSVVTKSNTFTIIENETVVSTISAVNRTFSGATSGYSYNNPIIPAGFVAVNTHNSKWTNLSTDYNNGLVIQDQYGNQFVWVPVDGTNVTYTKWCTKGLTYNDASISDDTLPYDFTTNITTTYKGFYIARYEAVFDYNGGTIRAASKKSTNVSTSGFSKDASHTGYLWSNISYTDSKTYSENMATRYNYDTSKVGTNLVTGAQWDTTLKWMQNASINVTTDSSSWGNYDNVSFNYEYPTSGTKISGHTTLNTGAAIRNRAKNIYDLAGNLAEFTNELKSAAGVIRAGAYVSPMSGSSYPAAYRGYENNYNGYTGFRFALYIK